MGSLLSTPGGEDDPVGVQHTEPLDTAAGLAAADARFAAALQRPLPPQRDVSEDGPVSVESRVEYSALPKGASQAIFGLVTLRAEAQVASSERRHMDLVCVLDISGSMGDQNKIGDLKSAMRFIIDELQPTDRLSIVTFENFGHRCLRLRRMDSQGRDEATVQTMRLQAGGGTNIAEGLDLGLAVLEQRRQRNQVSAILLLTDGQDSSFRCAIPSMVRRAGKAGAGLYAFGFGQDHDADLLRGVSEHAKTPYTFIEDTATVKEAFAGVVGGLSSVVAQNLQLKLDCSAVLVDVNTPFEVVKSGDTKATVSIPDIFAGERRDVLLELSIPADLAGDSTGKLKLLEASVRYLNLQPPGSGSGSVLVQSPPETMRESYGSVQKHMSVGFQMVLILMPVTESSSESTVELSQLGTLLFEPVDGGVSRACRGASAADNSPLNFQLSSASDLTFCQLQCMQMETCQGVEYHPSNWRCELWTTPGGIQASIYFETADCYRRVAKLEPVDGGDDRACRGANPSDNNPAHYVVHPHSVLDDCERQCIATPECRGIEYSFGRCEVWVRGEGIESSVALPGFKCFRVAQLATTVTATTTATATSTSQTVTATSTASTTVSSLDAPPIDDPQPPQPLDLVFRAVDGGMNRACRGADANDNSQSYFQVFTVTGLEDCKNRCRETTGCVGIEFINSRCEVWTRRAGIEASFELANYQCLQALAFHPVDGGSDRACRGASVTDNSPDYYVVFPETSLADCKDRCAQTEACVGMEYSDGRCEVWTRSGGILASAAVVGFQCFQLSSPTRQELLAEIAASTWEVVGGGVDRECRGADWDDDSPGYFSERCLELTICKGVEYRIGHCELWTRPEGIGATAQRPSDTSAPSSGGAAPRTKYVVHYMPWFLGIRTPGLYDHWCVGNSFYESYLGLYDQNQREVVGQQLDLMKSSGIDGLWIDYQLTSWDSVVALPFEAYYMTRREVPVPDWANGTYPWITADLEWLEEHYKKDHSLSSFAIGAAYRGFRDCYSNRVLHVPFLQMLEPSLLVTSKYQPEFVQVLTWNDYSEGTMIEPSWLRPHGSCHEPCSNAYSVCPTSFDCYSGLETRDCDKPYGSEFGPADPACNSGYNKSAYSELDALKQHITLERSGLLNSIFHTGLFTPSASAKGPGWYSRGHQSEHKNLPFVQRTEEPQPEQEPDAEVADQRERVEVAKALATAATKSDSGQFDEARSLLKRQREKVSRRTSHITQALTLELEDAEHRMESQLSWQTGHAEVRDALSMHRMQRCTNSLMSSSSQVYKRSKTMYVTSVQEAWSRTASASSTDL
ncbi:Inter-alpha-trypsin inhibitor heavy chain H4 [Symbiodinium microadriaticum]|uniref:Inter-alpha-trypsin inhibitor heavy chain H4 n=1 Tax=Symbiodinium microadriaticum TaxID=2951 RepID=A0A1Q9EUE8_SYMMI|nr:Inter-alpha-trypsin inhibitor heavy chain H4 [Symbiodinium microadriaticum]